MIPLLVLVGPTASGKTELSLRLAEALGGEIVGADSVQIYRDFLIGAAQPTPAERARAPHHLIGELAPGDEVDANRYVALASEAIADIDARDRLPIVCGGTFLWVRALLFGLAEAPAGDETIRERHRAWAERDGRQALHAELARVDAPTAARLHPNDFIRVSRALEVYELSGRRMSDVQGEHGFRQARYDARLLGLEWPRDVYDARVAARARIMWEQGLLTEVGELLAAGHGQARAMGAVGYKQVRAALERGPIQQAELLDEIVRATRVFARRQRTWLREQPVEWWDAPSAYDEPAWSQRVDELRRWWDATRARRRERGAHEP
ncbi:MAG TPA: tRNA (adenosine(37)-N6)-dimethylallyltransferase MiaA [Polyangiaceae bacterium]|nr:tRNA (adenosine(37)-N6)-dimethylallyltransferase MiaA [Polyangiaceae bacterium]